jgi:hypothetical protein
MIPPLSRFGASLPAYSTRPAFTARAENSKALGVSSRANTQRQGFSIVTLATMAYATGKKQYEVGFNAPQVKNKLGDIIARDNSRPIALFLKKHFESVFPHSADPLTVLQGWFEGSHEKRTAPIGEKTLRDYIFDCEFYAETLDNKDGLDTWVAQMRAKVQNAVLSPTKQRLWDSYLTYQNLETNSLQSSGLRPARQRGFTNLKRTLEALLEPSS